MISFKKKLTQCYLKDIQCVKSVRIRSYSGLYYPAFGLHTISPYSVKMWENTDQNNPEYGHFLRSDFKD